MTAARRTAVRHLPLLVAHALLWGQLALLAGHLVPPLVIALVCALQAAGMVWSRRRPRSQDVLARRVANVVCLCAGAYAAIDAARSSAGNPRAAVPYVVLALAAIHPSLWRTARDLQTGLTVAFGELVLASALGGGPWLGVPVVLGWLALLLGVRGVVDASVGLPRATIAAVAARAGGHVVVPEVVGSRGRRRPYGLTAVAGAALVGLAAFLAVPGADDLKLDSRWTRHQVQASAGDSTDYSRAAGSTAYVGSRLDLRARGQLPSTPLLSVPADTPTLWRGAVYSTYDGVGWSDGTALGVATRYPLPMTRSVPDASGTVVSADVTRLADDDITVYAPGVVAALDAPDASVAQSGQTLLLLPLAQQGRLPTTYHVRAVVPPDDPLTLGAAGLASGAPDPAYLQLPSGIPQRVLQLAVALTGGAQTTYDAVRAVESYLRTHERYRLDSPEPGAGEDAVDAFLFRDHVGFCEQFASAETVLLRSVGIPARLATGLAYGSPGRDPGTRVYRASDLHAWVEVYYPGVGWATSDPTAGAPLDAATSSTSSIRRALHALARLPHIWPGGRLGLAATLLALLVLGYVAGPYAAAALARLRARLARRRRRPPAVPSRRGSASTEAFRRLLGRLRAAGRPRRDGETLRDLAARLGMPERSVAVLEQEWYGAQPPPADECAAAATEIDRVGAGPG